MIRAVPLLVLVGCALAGDEEGSTTSEAPLVGVDGSVDQADRNCNVVLRSLERNGETSGSSWVWTGVVEISPEAAAEALAPVILYHHVGPNPWMAGTTTAIDATHFAVRLDRDLVGPGMSASAITNARVEVVPYLPLAGGGRLFDHNRNADDFANYTMTYPDLAIWGDASVCAAPAIGEHADLHFAADWSESKTGTITAGGTITVDYDISRLQTCRHSRNGYWLYDITAWVKFDSGQLLSASVRDAAATFTVPTNGARSVSVWFESTSATGCHAFDSNFGNNYVWQVARAPQWIGNAQTHISRDTFDPCDGGTPIQNGFTFDSWARQRAAYTNLCVEVYAPGEESLAASVHWRVEGSPVWTIESMPYLDQRGNNARFAMSWRPIDPYRQYQCVPATAQRIEYYLVVNGAELRPAPGGAYAGTFSGDACTTH